MALTSAAKGYARSVTRRVLRRGDNGAAAMTLDLDYAVTPDARHGYGKPAHPEIDAILRQGHERYRSLLAGFCDFGDELRAMQLEEDGSVQPAWINGWFQGVDFVALYGLIAQRKPSTYFEIGSGNSTRLVRRALNDHGLSTRMISVDPKPRRAVVDLVDEHIPHRFEDIDLRLLDQLQAGDVLFLDGSHRTFTNSDATVMFNEVLPRLAPGVLVHAHDIFLPWDYPPYWADRWYSEQYLLASWLLAGDRLEVVLPAMYVCINEDLHQALDPIWRPLTWAGIATNGSSFWFEMRGPS